MLNQPIIQIQNTHNLNDVNFFKGLKSLLKFHNFKKTFPHVIGTKGTYKKNCNI